MLLVRHKNKNSTVAIRATRDESASSAFWQALRFRALFLGMSCGLREAFAVAKLVS